MKVLNESDKDTNDIKVLTDFVNEYTNLSHMADVTVRCGEPGVTASGVAYKYAPVPVSAPGMVVVNLSQDIQYPYQTIHRKSVGTVTVHDWREEYVLVLAHELRHIAQFWSTEEVKYKEVDAEKFAMRVLSEWRAIQRNVR